MIFNTESDFYNTESYKERNLYYKIFAGYLFNEIVVGYDQRKLDFLNLLEKQINEDGLFFGEKSSAVQIISTLKNKPVTVTFDYHPAQIFEDYKKDNRGEMSDILILSNSEMLSIECKFLSNINYDKDITEVQERIIKFKDKFFVNPLQILLLKQSKWQNSKNIKLKLEAATNVPVVVVFWEQLCSLLNDKIVQEYLQKQIVR